MEAKSPEAAVRAFVSAINRHDPEALVALMTPGHLMIDALGNRMQGRENLRPAWIGYFGLVPDYEVVIEENISNGPAVVILGGREERSYATANFGLRIAGRRRWRCVPK